MEKRFRDEWRRDQGALFPSLALCEGGVCGETEGIWSSLSASSPAGVGPVFRVGGSNRSSRFSWDVGKITP